jgi:N-acyl-D-amino-acid deacylase
MEQLKQLLDRELRRGAKGMSLGLIYPPSAFSSQEELVELSKVIAKHGGLLAVHMRNEGARVFEAVDEMITIARLSGAHVHISHLKLMGKPQWGRSTELLQKIRDARSEGVHITCDQYPFHASSTLVTAMVPHWAHAGGPEELMRRLREREGTVVQEIQKEMENRGGPHAVLVVNTRGAHPAWEGMYMDEIAQELGVDPVDAVIRVVLETKTVGECIYFSMDAQDVMNIMKEPYICVGSDGNALSFDKNFTKSNVHPRHFAAFSQFFQTVRENSLMPIEQAVHKTTGLAAQIMNISDRGILAEGMAADITVFDPDSYESRSTFMESRVPPVGVRHVLVNGKFAMRDGAITQTHNGKVI